MSYASSSGDIRIALAGDCMPTRRLSVYDEPAYTALVAAFRDADAGFVNLETVVRNEDEGSPAMGQGTPMTTPPALLEDLKWMGVSLVSCANNHAFDHGEGGLLATLRHLDAAGIVHAGTGRNLAAARRPAYCDTRAGRVALVAVTATFKPYTRAGAQRGDMHGRPGVNPLGSRTTYRVDGAAFDELRRTSRELGFDRVRARNRNHFYSATEAPPERAEELELFGQHFVRGADFGATSIGAADDFDGNLRSIREAKRQADWVIVSVHSHEFAQRNVALTMKEELERMREQRVCGVDAHLERILAGGRGCRAQAVARCAFGVALAAGLERAAPGIIGIAAKRRQQRRSMRAWRGRRWRDGWA